MRPGGLFISLEGLDFIGKSTQVRLLAKTLGERGLDPLMTFEPGGTEIGRKIREILLDIGNASMDFMTELLLYNAARRQHITEVIKPALEAGRIVVSDRFSDSTMAYQGYGRGIDKSVIADLDRIATGGLKPHVTVLLDMDPVDAAARAHRSRPHPVEGVMEGPDRLESEELEFHKRVREGFLSIRASEPERVRLVDASGGIEETHEKVIEALSDMLDNS